MKHSNKWIGRCVCGAAFGAVAMAPLAARAQGTTSSSTTTTTTTTAGDMSSMSMAPTQVTGTVLRYYVDESGYVTAMDVQTANGVEMVRFAPGMGQRIYNAYPVNSQASVYVQPSMSDNMTRYDLAGMGATMPAPGSMMMPYMVREADLLDAQPWIMNGTRLATFKGRLTNFITNDRGEIVGLVVDRIQPMYKTQMSQINMSGGMMGGAMNDSGMMNNGMMNNGTMNNGMMDMSNSVLVRVPREFRHIDPGYAGTARVAPLFKGADVEVTGYPEAPVYGVRSIYGGRVTAQAITLNGRSVGALGFPLMSKMQSRALFNKLDIGGTKSPEEIAAMNQGYSTYSPEGATMGMNSMSTGTTSTGTTNTSNMGSSTMGGSAAGTATSSGTGTTSNNR